MIPKKQGNRKKTYPDLYNLEIEGSYIIGDYTPEKMRQLSCFLFYHNKSRKPKKLVQRKVNNQLVVYRER